MAYNLLLPSFLPSFLDYLLGKIKLSRVVRAFRRWPVYLFASFVIAFVSACGGGGGGSSSSPPPGGGGGTAVAPSITTQPANQSVVAGAAATFSVTASGTAPLSYQWRKGGANISGATSASYTTLPTSSANNGEVFSVVVTNSAGSVTSSNATLTVTTAAVAPSITAQPANQSVAAGQTATFSVTASGTAPLSYQWRKGGTNISGATSASYTTLPTSSANNGEQFSVVVTNSAGSVTSNNATLTVTTGTGAVFPATLELSALTAAQGFQIIGLTAGEQAGMAVAAAGDVNGDGIGDIIVGAPNAAPNGALSGAAYVVFGKAGGVGKELKLADLNGTNGFRIVGTAAGQLMGGSVSGAGDLNGDGVDDIAVGASGAAAAYVIYGQKGGAFPATFNGSDLNGTNGFRIAGAALNDGLGRSVSGAGDVNGDGITDLVVGAPGYGGAYENGAAYVIYGRKQGVAFPPSIALGSLTAADGFRVTEPNGTVAVGTFVSFGDINGDGFADLLVAGPGTISCSGARAYVVLGKTGGLPNLNLGSLGINGFRLSGVCPQGISSAGDVNGDGVADYIVSEGQSSQPGGSAFVIFGKRGGGFSATLDVSTLLNGTDGFRINGTSTGIVGGRQNGVARAGDVNGDGIDDLILGSPGADLNGANSGGAWIVYGRKP